MYTLNKMQNQANTSRYHGGKIYQIVCNTTGKIYVGSTCTPRLCHRLAEHASSYRRYLNGKLKTNYTSFNVLEGGNYKIYLLERCPCESKEELLKKERDYIEQIDCVNKVIPGRSKKEHYKANKDRISEYNKEHYKANKDRISEYKKANREKITEYNKEHYKANKQKINERASAKVKCACGAEVRRNNLLRHQITKKHIDKMNQNNNFSD